MHGTGEHADYAFLVSYNKIVHNYSSSDVKVATQFEIQMNKISAVLSLQIILNVLFLACMWSRAVDTRSQTARTDVRVRLARYIYFCYSEYYRHSLSFSSHGAVFQLPSAFISIRRQRTPTFNYLFPMRNRCHLNTCICFWLLLIRNNLLRF
jgi:hypothetical protein